MPVSTRRHVDVRKVIEDLHRRYPRTGTEKLAGMLAERIEEDRHLLLDAARSLVRQVLVGTEGRERQRRASSAPVRAKREASNQVAVRQLVGKVKTAVLDMVIGNKQLRFLTGSEVARLGAGFVKLAERVPADAYVGEVVTEAEAAELLQGDNLTSRPDTALPI
jgi:hypothetical protein